MNHQGVQKVCIDTIKGYVVNGVLFRRKEDVENAIRDILHLYPPRTKVSLEHLEFLLDVLSNHPRSLQKIGCGVTAMEVRVNPHHQNNRGFWLIRTDNSETDWSFVKCIHPVKPINLFSNACRHAIADQIREFRVDWVKQYADTEGYIVCPVTNERILPDNAHVDHIPPQTFDHIMHSFIKDQALDISSVELSGAEDGKIGRGLADTALCLNWQSYHKRVAQLRVVSIIANLSQIPRQSR